MTISWSTLAVPINSSFELRSPLVGGEGHCSGRAVILCVIGIVNSDRIPNLGSLATIFLLWFGGGE